MVTLKDIAAVCEVNYSTVSKALNGYTDISECTRKRIIDAALRMGYRTEGVQDAKERTWLMGIMILDDETLPLYQAVLLGIHACLTKRGYDMVLIHQAETGRGAPGGMGYLAKARHLGLEGVFILSGVDEQILFRTGRLRGIRDLLTGEIPVVVIDSTYRACRCVVPGYEEGVNELIKYIYGNGHRRVAFVHGDGADDNGVPERGGRWERTLFAALAANSREVSGDMVRCVRAGHMSEAYSAAAELIQSWHWLRPTCVLFTDDSLLKGGMAAIRDCGLRIPEDISVAALQFMAQREDEVLRVSSWRFDPVRIADAAVELMLAGAAGHRLHGNRVLTISGTFCPGNTVAKVSK